MCLMRARRRALKLQRLIGCSNVAYGQRCLRVNGVPRRFTTAANALCKMRAACKSSKAMASKRQSKRLPLSLRVHPSYRSDDSSVLASTWRQSYLGRVDAVRAVPTSRARTAHLWFVHTFSQQSQRETLNN